jgi:short-subunit dehydrogenase
VAVALITGASSGIGEQFAYALARETHALALTARREDRLQAVAAQARSLGASSVNIFPADLSQPPAPAQLYRNVAAAGLKIDLLVNNAGFGTRGRFDHLPLAREIEQIELNVTALVELTHLFLPDLIAARRGTIINVASTAGFQAVPYMATYGATKAFVVSFSLALHHELNGTGVNVMALCPGATRTEFQAVARNEDTVPSFVYMEADTVVAQALRAAHKNRSICINGALNRIATEAQRVAPRGLVAWIAGMLYRPQ